MASRLKITIYVAAFMLMLSCNMLYTKEKYINDFRSFVNEVKSNCSTYSDKDWAIADERYIKYTTIEFDKYKHELTDEEKESISKLKGVYNLIIIKKGANDLMEETLDVINQVKGMIEEVSYSDSIQN